MRFGRGGGVAALGVAVALALAGPAGAQTTEERLAAYEKAIAALQAQVEALRKEVAELRAARPSPEEPTPQRPPAPPAPPRTQIFGYLQSQFDDGFSEGRTRGLVRRARLGVRGQLERDFAYEVQIDAAASSSLLRNAWIDYTGWRAGPWSPTVRFGQSKLPYSLEAIESSTTIPLVERALVVDALAVSHDRDTGLHLLSRPDRQRPYAYQVAFTNGAGRNQFTATRNKLFAGRVQINTPEDRPVLGGRVALGFSTRQGHVENLNQPAGLRSEDERYGVDLDYLSRRWRLRGEYLWGRNDERNPRGFYGLAAYRLLPDLELVGRYEGFSPDDDAGRSANRTTLGATYFFSRNTKAMLNYELLHGRAPGDLRSGLRFRLQTLFP